MSQDAYPTTHGQAHLSNSTRATGNYLKPKAAWNTSHAAAAIAAATAAAADAEERMRALEETARRITATGHNTQLLPRLTM